jgi:hypothetical protein
MNNVILPIAMWAAIGLAGLSILVMGVSGLRSIWFGKVKPLTIAIIALPAVIILVLGGVMETWIQAGIYTLVTMLGLVLLGMVGTAFRSAFESAFG